MSKELLFLIYWTILTIISIGIGLLHCYRKNKKNRPVSLSEFMTIAISTATIISSINLSYKIISSQELQKLLQFDIYIFGLGVIAVIWLSIQQIWNIFK